jgi:hypothetical protein
MILRPRPPRQIRRLLAEARRRWRRAARSLGSFKRGEGDFDTDFEGIAELTAAKAVKTCQAIIRLCGAGFGEDAMMLTRSLLEAAMALAYMEADATDARSQRLLDFDYSERAKKLGALLREHGEMLAAVGRLEDAKRALPGLKELQQGFREAHQIEDWREERTWSGKSVRHTFEAAGLLWLYNTLYKDSSELLHYTPAGLGPYAVRRRGTYGVTAQPRFEGRHVEGSLRLAPDCLEHIFRIWERARGSGVQAAEPNALGLPDVRRD